MELFRKVRGKEKHLICVLIHVADTGNTEMNKTHPLTARNSSSGWGDRPIHRLLIPKCDNWLKQI